MGLEHILKIFHCVYFSTKTFNSHNLYILKFNIFCVVCLIVEVLSVFSTITLYLGAYLRVIFICLFSICHCEQNSSFNIFEILLFSFRFLVWICHCKLSSPGPSQCMQLRCVASNCNFNGIKYFVSHDISHNECSFIYVTIEIIIFGQGNVVCGY